MTRKQAVVLPEKKALKKKKPFLIGCISLSMFCLLAILAFIIVENGIWSNLFSPNMPPVVIKTRISIKDGMALVFVPEGEFVMDGFYFGSTPHMVDLDAYWIDQTEVTNAMFALCVQAGKCQKPAPRERSSEYDEHPAIFIRWDNAQSYCSWAEARLPTEAEWEKAARGTDGRVYPWGNDKDFDENGKITRKLDFRALNESVAAWPKAKYDAIYSTWYSVGAPFLLRISWSRQNSTGS